MNTNPAGSTQRGNSHPRTELSLDAGRLQIGQTVVQVLTNDAGFAEAARWAFRDLAVEDVQQQRPPVPLVVEFEVRRRDDPWTDWGIWRDGEPCETTLTEGYVLFHLQWEFNRLVLERPAPSLHAAAVLIGGAAIVCCGSSTSGKTTFAGWLTTRGAQYLADEVVALSEDATTMAPFPRPLGLRHGGPLAEFFAGPNAAGERFNTYEMLIPASELGSVSSSANYPVGAIVFPRYIAGDPPSMTLMEPSEAFEAVCASCPTLAMGEPKVFSSLASLVRRVPAISLGTSHLEAAAQMLYESLESWNVLPDGALK